MKIRLAVPALAMFLAMPAVWAQGAASAAPAKVGVINVQVAITSTAEGKQAAAELQSKFAPRQTELETMRKDMDDLQTRLRTGQTTLSDDEKARLARQGDQLNRSYQRKQQEAQDDFNDEQQDVVNRIGRKMVAILDKYSKENGYAVILDTSAQQTPVVFAANQIDVTQDIIRLLRRSESGEVGGVQRRSFLRRNQPPRGLQLRNHNNATLCRINGFPRRPRTQSEAFFLGRLPAIPPSLTFAPAVSSRVDVVWASSFYYDEGSQQEHVLLENPSRERTGRIEHGDFGGGGSSGFYAEGSEPEGSETLRFPGQEKVVIVFYPLDWSPVCTNEHACFVNDMKRFEQLDAQVLGVSVDSAWSHKAFAEKMGIHLSFAGGFPAARRRGDKFGVYLADKGITGRAIAIVDRGGKIAWFKNYDIPTVPDINEVSSALATVK